MPVIIALVAPKGGVGRTSAAALLGSALAAGRQGTLLVDSGDEARACRPGQPGPLELWSDRLRAHGSQGLPLSVATARDVGDLLAVLDDATRTPEEAAAAARRAWGGGWDSPGGPPDPDPVPDVVLVDTAGRTDDRARLALRAADLVVAPFRTATDATLVHRALDRDLPPGLPVLGLPCGVVGAGQDDGGEGGDDGALDAACEAFGRASLLPPLPLADGLLHGLWEGWLAPHGLDDPHGGGRGAGGLDDLEARWGRPEREAAARAWAAATRAAGEAMGLARRAAEARERGPGAHGLRLARPARRRPS